MRFLLVLVVLLAIQQMGVAAEKAENQTFIATKEWQEIREGQGIPAGLHVRINLQTGKKEAKLLDDGEQKDAAANNSEGTGALSTLPPENNGEAPKGAAKLNLKISKTLSDALKNLPKDGLALEYSPEKLEKIKREYKSYKELKESYEDIRNSFKTDAEIISQLVGQYRNISKAELEPPLTPELRVKTQLRILDNFNYLVHQIDNAVWFIDEGGLDQVLLPLVVNQTHVGLRVQAMRVLGALTQNNPKAQVRVFERNFGSHLAQILSSSAHTEELSAALYAFGSLVRKYPHAQQRLLAQSGTQALVAVLAKECELKIKAKAAALISDLIVERQLVLANASDDEDPENAAQYAELHFADWLQSYGYCDTLDTLIASKLYEFLEQPDAMEYFTVALENTQSFCAPLWSQSPQLRHTLLTVHNRFVHSKEEYRGEVAQHVAKVLSALYPAAAGGAHDEL